jgi:chromosome segregation ATPase
LNDENKRMADKISILSTSEKPKDFVRNNVDSVPFINEISGAYNSLLSELKNQIKEQKSEIKELREELRNQEVFREKLRDKCSELKANQQTTKNHDLELKLKSSELIITDLEKKLQVNDAVRQNMQTSFLQILHQTQKELSNSHLQQQNQLMEKAYANHQTSLESERKKWQNQVLELESNINIWKVRAEGYELEIKTLKNQLNGTSNEKEKFQNSFKENLVLKEKLKNLQDQLLPEMRNYVELQDKIVEMENKFDQREGEWEIVMTNLKSKKEEEIQGLNDKYKSIIEKKNDEIRYFQKELNLLVHAMEQLKSN